MEDLLDTISRQHGIAETFRIPEHKKEKLEAFARCTFRNKERVKKEYEEKKKQKKIDKYISEERQEKEI